MVSFHKDEVFTATQVVRNFSTILKKVRRGILKRVIVAKNNHFDVVIINMAEYERLSQAVEILESIYSKTHKATEDEEVKNGE